jgi:hypothetical protein
MRVDADQYAAFLNDVVRKQNRLLTVRVESSSHEVEIKDALTPSSDQREFNDLLEKTFSHHELKDFHPIARSDVNLENTETISKWFHKKYFVPISLKRGYSHTNAELPEDEFFDRVAPARPFGRTNNIQFLVGPVGSGKTTYVCNLLFRKFSSLLVRRLIPIRLNIDTLTEHRIPTAIEIATTFYNQTVASLRLNKILTDAEVLYLANNSRVTQRTDATHVLECLAHLISILSSKNGFRVLFVVDNVDFLYHLGDRGSFARELEQQQRDAYEAIISLVRLFARDDQVCANQSLNILYCLRKDTLEYMQSKHAEVPLPTSLSSVSAFFGSESELNELGHTYAVIEKRFELLADISEDISEPAKRAEFKAQANRLQKHYSELPDVKRDVPLYRHMWSLSRRGLRDFIEQIKSYSWLEFADAKRDLNTRFTQSYSPAILAYILGGRRRYAQFQGGLPNLYLVNAPAPSNEVGVPAEMKAPHFATYWLKRLILEYVEKSKERFLDSELLIRAFTGSNGRGYPEPLVRYLFGHLAQVPESECLQCDLGAAGTAGTKVYTKHIRLTRRGRFLLAGFAQSFTYLQLVIDDWRMPIPKALEKEWAYCEPDYGYLVSTDRYGELLAKVLSTKARQTIQFAILLEEMLSAEKRLLPNVFKRMIEAGVELPTHGEIVRQVRNDLEKITTYSSASTRLGIKEYISAEYELRQRTRIQGIVDELTQPHFDLQNGFYVRSDTRSLPTDSVPIK